MSRMDHQEHEIKTIFCLLQEICRNLFPNLPDEEVKRLVKMEFLKINLPHENSNPTNYEDDDDKSALRKIEIHLMQSKKGHLMPHVNDLFRVMKHNNTVTQRVSILKFLLELSEQKSSFNSSNGIGPVKFKKPRTPESPIGNMAAGDSVHNNWITTQRHTSPTGNNTILNNVTIFRPTSLQMNNNASLSHNRVNKVVVPESKVIADLMYCWQGIPGDIMKLDPHGNFYIDPHVTVKNQSMLEHLIELGYLHNRAKQLISSLAKGGSVAQAVNNATKKLLMEYYGFICFIQDKLGSGKSKYGDDTPIYDDDNTGDEVSLPSLMPMVNDPMLMMQTLIDAVSCINSNQGGAIVSALYPLLHHGNPKISSTVLTLLNFAGNPLMKMLQIWLVQGELVDPFDEFFITIHKNCEERDVWHNKFYLRQNLVPNIITKKQADMILRAGKGVHFLNVICNQKCPITGYRKKLHKFEDPILLDLCNQRSELSQLISNIFEEVSAQVLNTLVNQFKLYQHFEGMQKYILLCKGDFANYLMDFLEPEMKKEADKLQTFRLTGLLDSAVRASSAAFEDPEIISRVTVKLLVASPGDCGYDVFGLHYVMHESISAAFKLHEGAYSNMFNFLWRTKRMWYVLQNLVRQRWSVKKPLIKLAAIVPDVTGVLKLAERMSIELVHFAREMQGYLLFEVIECVWERLSKSFSKAKTLDDVISAHDLFISTILVRTFQDPDSRKFINELRLIWELVSDLEALEQRFLERCLKEIETRLEDTVNGLDYESEQLLEKRNKEFQAYLSSVRAQYTIFIRNYQDVLKKFLLALSTIKNDQLRMLSTRLDYNEYYKRNDSQITDSMKFSRCSDMYSELT